MALPKIDVPIYELKLPSSGKVIKVRPFSVKEEKLLFMAVESKKNEDIVNTVKQVINNCIISGEFSVDKAPFFDVDFLFIFLRAKSISESVEVNLTCNNEVEGKRCGNVFPTEMDIANCELFKIDGLTDDIKLGGANGVKMKYPSYSLIKSFEDDDRAVDKKIKLITNSIDYIYDKDGIYPAKDHSSEELKEFVEGLTEANYKKLEFFCDNFPTFVVKLDAKCTKCGFQHSVRYTDFYDFFF